MQRVPKSEGCALSGFVLVKKVPGTLHFLPKSAGHSFDYHAINMSHQVGYMYYGNKPSPRRRQVRPTLPMNASMNTFCIDCGEDYRVAEALVCHATAVQSVGMHIGLASDTLSQCTTRPLGVYRLWSSITQWGSQKTGQTRCRAPISTPKTRGPPMSTTCRSGLLHISATCNHCSSPCQSGG